MVHQCSMSLKRPLKKQSMQPKTEMNSWKNRNTSPNLSSSLPSLKIQNRSPAFNHLLIIIYSLLVSLSLLSSSLLCSRLFVLLNVWMHCYVEQFSRFYFFPGFFPCTPSAPAHMLKSQNKTNTKTNRNIFQLYHVYGGLIRGFNCAYSQLPSSQCWYSRDGFMGMNSARWANQIQFHSFQRDYYDCWRQLLLFS